jgi:hypothetical protein
MLDSDWRGKFPWIHGQGNDVAKLWIRGFEIDDLIDEIVKPSFAVCRIFHIIGMGA